MQIKVLQPFKHGRDSYHPDDVRTVSDEDGAYFAAHGWATRNTDPQPVKDPAPPQETMPPPLAVTLDVQSLRTSQGVQNG